MSRELYIVRHDLGHPAFGKGTLVAALCPSIGPARVTIRPHAKATPTMEAALASLLAFSSYLRIQPSDEFWCLRRRDSETGDDVYLSDAKTERYGSDKFRFESLGELVFWLKEHRQLAYHFHVGHYVYLPGLTTITKLKTDIKNAIT